jgi:hypothetical protein
MSGTFYDWRKLLDSAPLPFYQDTQAGGGATQQTLGGYTTAQDTAGTRGSTGWTKLADPFPMTYDPMTPPGGTPGGTGWSEPSTQVPYTAPSTTGGATGAGPFGYDYSGAAPGYNAWALYNGGTQDGGWYNAAADTQQWDAGRGNGTTENSRDRVWRWTLGDLKAQGLDPGQASVEAVNRAFLNNVARLHRDFDANGYNWQQSGFANFDRVLPAGSSGGTGSAGGGTAGGSTGGTGVNPPTPPMGQGLTAGALAGPNGPNGTPAPGSLAGGAGGIDQLYQNDRAYRTAQLLKALGLGDINSRLSYGGSVVAKQAPGLFEAWREAQGIGGGGVPNGTGQLGAFANVYNAPGALGNIAQTGQGALDWIMKQGGQGLSDEELIPLIQGFENLANIRQSDTMNRYYGNLTDQGLGQFLQGIGPNNLTARLVPYLQNNPLFGFLTGKR